MTAGYGSVDFQRQFDVSRETIARLVVLHDLVLRWNARINLVGRTTNAHIWQRHFADSAQLLRLCPDSAQTWADLGAGGGFPGLVVAALAMEHRPRLRLTLVESDTRKAVFLGEAARATDLAVRIICGRAEALDPIGADVLSARALSPLVGLLEHAKKHRSPGGIGLFPKGATVHKELEDAALRWRFDHRLHRSVTDANAAIVEVGAVSRV